MKNYGGPTQIVIDVNGYYIQQLQAYISSAARSSTSPAGWSARSRTRSGAYTLTWDRNVGTCSGQGLE